MQSRHSISPRPGTLVAVLAVCAALSVFAGSAAATTPADPPRRATAPATEQLCGKATATQEACDVVRRLNPAEPAGLAPGVRRPNVTPSGYSPADLRSAYNLPSTGGTGETVAIVVAYDDPNIESDLAVYRSQFGEAPCTTANGCFSKVNQSGATSPLPAAAPPATPAADWRSEIPLDVEMVSAICQNCHLLLVEANDATMPNLGTGVNRAVTMGAKFVSTSFYFAEASADTSYDSSYFNHPGVAITAVGGDSGPGANYPGSSRYVTAVGGTSLVRASNARGWSETAWNTGLPKQDTSSGCSAFISQPVFQDSYTNGCGDRATNDVSAVADPTPGVAIYQTYGFTGWGTNGGTSAASPIIAGVYALAGTPGATDTPNYYPYVGGGSGGLNDVTSGSTGTCSPAVLCNAGYGWDGPTGLGTPNGLIAFQHSRAIFVKNPGPQTSYYGSSVYLPLSAWDSQSGTSLSYSASMLPPGLSISSSGGYIYGTPTCTTFTRSFSVGVYVNDGVAGGSTSISWTVNSHPTCP